MNSKVISFFGADFKVGTSAAAFHTAKTLADADADLKVLLIRNQWDIKDAENEDAKTRLNGFAGSIVSRTVSVDHLLDSSRKIGSLHYLACCFDAVRETGEISDFMKIIEPAFDLILVDCGSTLTTDALSFMHASPFRLLVTTQQAVVKASYLLKSKHLQTPEVHGTVVNKYILSPHMPMPAELEETYGKLTAVLPHVGIEAGWRAETDIDCFKKDKWYCDGIDDIAAQISETAGFQYKRIRRRTIWKWT